MNNWENKLHVVKSIIGLQNKNCPYCKSNNTVKMGQNAPLSHVRECQNCHLLFRWPKQNVGFNKSFYQHAYSKYHHSPVTDLPTSGQVSEYMQNNFLGSEKDFSHYASLINKLGCHSVLDYGCSWGYGVFQFQSSGLLAEGLEVSMPRAEFGRQNLGVTIHNSSDEVVKAGKKYDCVFSSHVLEHLPSPEIAFGFFKKIVNVGGILILEVPNCGGKNAETMGLQWGPFSSAIHPLSYKSDFFLFCFGGASKVVHFMSKPFDPETVIKELRRVPCTSSPTGDDLISIVLL